MQLFPEPFVRPFRRVHVDSALQIVAAACRRTLGTERETALVVDVDELLRDRWRVGKQSQPAEGIDPLECFQDIAGNGVPADAVIADAAGDEVSVETMPQPVFL